MSHAGRKAVTGDGEKWAARLATGERGMMTHARVGRIDQLLPCGLLEATFEPGVRGKGRRQGASHSADGRLQEAAKDAISRLLLLYTSLLHAIQVV